MTKNIRKAIGETSELKNKYVKKKTSRNQKPCKKQRISVVGYIKKVKKSYE